MPKEVSAWRQELPKGTPTTHRGDDLMMCPICFGHTILKGSAVYCPHCDIVITENLTDAMKTKVALIKEAVDVQKELPKIVQAERHAKIATLIGVIIGVMLFLVAIVVGVTGYSIIKAKAYEKNGDYAKAIQAYQESRLIITVPGLDQSIARANRLKTSSENYQTGMAAFSKKQWQLALLYLNMVDKEDANYERAQVAKRLAQTQLNTK